MSLICVLTAALSEGKEKKQQGKLLPPERQPTSQEEPAAPRLLRPIPGAHASSQGDRWMLEITLCSS